MSMGVCVMSATEVFDQDDEGKAIKLIDELEEASSEVEEAVKSCPTGAISLEQID